MIAAKENPAPVLETTPEQEALLKRASAPTLRDLRTAAKCLFPNAETETDSPSMDDSLSQQES
jgi:hypothetical protein